MRYLSVCSGIEAATVAWHPLGWSPVAFSEIEKFPSAVLAHHYPDVPNLGDMTKILESEVLRGAAIDLLVGGTPCQSFSVAGLRKGLADPRGNLALVYLGLADALRPRWLVWENVPGVLSSNGGRDFGAFLGALGELGYGFSYRVLDAQYFGVAQRRRRVFVVGHLGGWAGAAAVLLERDGLSGNPPPSREPGQGSAGRAGRSSRAGGDVAHTLRGEGFDASEDGTGRGIPLVAGCKTARDGKGPDSDCTGTLIPFDTTNITSATNRANPRAGDPCHPLAAQAHPPAVAFDWQASGSGDTSFKGKSRAYIVRKPEEAGTLQANKVQAVHYAAGVRRLTPRECERLQGFPDDYTLTPYRGKPAADGPRYKALGNSMAVPVMAWIGRRIAEVDRFSGH